MRVEVYAPGDPPAGEVLVIPPGLAGAPTSEALASLRAFAEGGGHVLGLGDGVAWLCAAGLLPGEVTRAEPRAPATHVRVEGRATPFTWAIPAGRILAVADGSEGARFTAPDAELAALTARGRVVLRYCDAAGGIAGGADQRTAVAGISDETGRVFGLLAPATPRLDCALGRQLLACLRR